MVEQIGDKIVRHGRYVTFQMAEVAIPRDLFAGILSRIERLSMSDHDFSALHDAMQRYVDDEILPGVSAAVLAGRDLVDVHLYDPSD